MSSQSKNITASLVFRSDKSSTSSGEREAGRGGSRADLDQNWRRGPADTETADTLASLPPSGAKTKHKPGKSQKEADLKGVDKYFLIFFVVVMIDID